MKTKKQEDLVNEFLSRLNDESRPIYQNIIMYLSEIGYYPYKQRSYIVFKHDLHNKQMAKTGIRINKDKSAFFALRFSACNGYSDRFADLVKAAVAEENFNEAKCIYNNCDFCKGVATTHVYSYTFQNGKSESHCGAVALEIPNVTADDIGEIKKLIKEEHEYLLKHEAGMSVI
ncbi:MAG: hypothetical protein K0S41_2359 [Anaerocolumna sp.]|jgi:hypothetical protein|nr:hypothetical protein [Anaerocolumna sp.]